jgi:hypothetical protein
LGIADLPGIRFLECFVYFWDSAFLEQFGRRVPERRKRVVLKVDARARFLEEEKKTRQVKAIVKL